MNAIELVVARTFELSLKRLETRGTQDHVNTVKSLATDRWRLQPEARCVQTTGGACRFAKPFRVDLSSA